jgi:beta-1,2-mannosidase
VLTSQGHKQARRFSPQTQGIRGMQISWESKNVLNPAIVVRGAEVVMLYRAQDSAGTSRIGIAESADGIHFVRGAEPVLYPDNDDQKKYEWPGGCEDPRIVQDQLGAYILTYSAFDGHTARLMVATSTDLRHWRKRGPAFAKAYGSKYINSWSKSGAIVARYENSHAVATQINGQYHMYWGDQFIWEAVSSDLVNWQPVEMGPGERPPVALKGEALRMPQLRIVVATRSGKFDSDLVESGPPAMLTEKGILLVYNGRNIVRDGDSTLVEGTYAAGQVLMDKQNPSRVIVRLGTYFMKPDKDYEQQGQVNQVCFLEGLAYFNHHWLLYYGTADSKIAVASKD